jgi:hypothetical protein
VTALPVAFNLIDLAKAIGASPDDIVNLQAGQLTPEHLDFLGLMRAREQQRPSPDAVVLSDGQPMLYLWDLRRDPNLDTSQVRGLLEKLALRSDAPYVAVLRPGKVQLFALGSIRDDVLVPMAESAELDPGLMARLATGDVPDRQAGISTHDLMLELLNSVTSDLIERRGLAHSEALALIGRALFLRFLHDRKILRETNPLPGVERFVECLATPTNAAASCRWLDETFNGDLLPLPDGGNENYFAKLAKTKGESAFADLTAILRGDKPVGDGAYQTQFTWAHLDFEYLPVGLLSQVYEAYAHRFEAETAKEASVYYTPRHLAEYVVDHALAMLGDRAEHARILDPAAGAGVFLLAAFRRLVQRRWRTSGKQPTTRVIREILNNQLVGVDINPAARQLTALALYLTALELDPNTASLQNLKFKALQDRVLIAAENWSDNASGISLGSLSQPSASSLHGQFDLVLGNPPWTSAGIPAFHKALDTNARTAMQERGLIPVPNPDGVPDLPFVWQATRWAKPDGVLAFALHARLLTKTAGPGMAAREALFNGLDVSYVLNGMALRQTQVWPNMQAQFCLLFAHNRRPSENSRFYAVTPVLDEGLNREGRVRIDSKDAWASDASMVAQIPYLFKALAKGNALDIELIERVERNLPATRSRNAVPKVRLKDYVNSVGIRQGQGYKTTRGGTLDASFLRGMPVMPDPRDARWNIVPVEELDVFSLESVYRIRSQEIYDAPLVLLRKSPSTRDGAPLAMLALAPVAYRESYYGYSCAKATEPQLTAIYLWAVLNSDLFLYYILMTSSIFGCERDAMQKSDADQFPMVPLASFSAEQMASLRALEKEIASNQVSTNSINFMVNGIYGLSEADVNLVRDRLATELPFSRVRSAAVTPPSDEDIQQYCDALARTLRPFDTSSTILEVHAYPQSAMSPWRFVRLSERGASDAPSIQEILGAVGLADGLDCSLVEFRRGDMVVFGLLNQRRYWTRTAARTLALDIIKRSDPLLNRDRTKVRAS